MLMFQLFDEAPQAYENFQKKEEDGFVKVGFQP